MSKRRKRLPLVVRAFQIAKADVSEDAAERGTQIVAAQGQLALVQGRLRELERQKAQLESGQRWLLRFISDCEDYQGAPRASPR